MLIIEDKQKSQGGEAGQVGGTCAGGCIGKGRGRQVGAGEGEATERVKLAAHFLAPGSCEVGGDRPATCFVQNSYVAVSALTLLGSQPLTGEENQPTCWPVDALSMNMWRLLTANDVT